MKIFSVISCLILSIAASAALASSTYKCVGKNVYGDRIWATLVASDNAVIFNGRPASLDLKYKPKSRKDKIRFLFDAGSYGTDLYSSGILVSKEVLLGAEKVFLTQDWRGEGYQNDHYICFAN
jgi:hypothetical protein